MARESHEEQLIQALAVIVQEKRQALGRTQLEFAVLNTGLGHSYFADFEQGLRSPTILTMRRLAQGFQLEASHLLALAERRIEGKRHSVSRLPKLRKKIQLQEWPEWLLLNALSVVVRERREELGLTPLELSQRAGLSHSYIGLLELKSSNISVKNLSKLAVALHVKASRLLALVEARAQSPEWLLLNALSIVVRERRETLGLTRLELSQRAGLNHDYIGLLELNFSNTNISVKTLSKLAAGLHLKASRLLALVEAVRDGA